MWKYLFSKQQRLEVLLLGGDSVLVLLSLSLAVVIKVYRAGENDLPWTGAQTVLIYGLLVGGSLLAFYILGLYSWDNQRRRLCLFAYLSLSMGAVLVMFSTLAYFIPALRPGKILVVMFAGLSVAAVWGWHWLAGVFFPVRPQRLVLIGQDRVIQEIVQMVQQDHSQAYEIAAHWHQVHPNPTLGNLSRLAENKNIDAIIYSVGSQILKEVTDSLLNLRFRQLNVYDAPTFYQRLTGKLPVFHLDDFWMLINSQREVFFPRLTANLKRVFDIFLVVLCLPLALPLILIGALAIRLDSKGPVFFIQERLGRNEVPFRLVKFRTMVDHAEQDNGPQWANEGDPRVTRVGKILRKLRLDELPQLFNVLKGEMSVVGPRPIRRHFADLLAQELPYYRLRFLVKPGLTGWAQINYDYAGSVEGQAEKLQYELFYLVHQSLWLDFFIILKTLRVMLLGKGT
ncbi:MAG: sugar transferase [Desulfobacteraceae bacterium]